MPSICQSPISMAASQHMCKCCPQPTQAPTTHTDPSLWLSLHHTESSSPHTELSASAWIPPHPSRALTPVLLPLACEDALFIPLDSHTCVARPPCWFPHYCRPQCIGPLHWASPSVLWQTVLSQVLFVPQQYKPGEYPLSAFRFLFLSSFFLVSSLYSSYSGPLFITNF